MARQNFTNIWASGGASTDPGAVKVALGWEAEKPPYQSFNWWQNRVDQMLQHVEQKGIPLWDSSTAYQINGLAIGSDGAIYQAVQANTGNNPVGSVVAPTYATVNWRRIAAPSTEGVAGVIEIATSAETLALSDDTRAVTPAKLAALAASTTQRGIAELADGAEAAALADTARVITPAALASVLATTGAFGLARLATAAEAKTGTAADRVLTPQSLGSLAQLLANPGYKTLPGGLIVNFGSTVIASATDDYRVVLPQAYSVAHLLAIGGGQMSGTGETGPHGEAIVPGTNPLTEVQLQTSFSGRKVNWISIGY